MYTMKTITKCTSGNEKIDDLIQEMQLKINNPHDIIFEWIPSEQFNDVKEIKIDTSLAIWKYGPLYYDSYKFKIHTKQE
jgi:hypothetical protein